MRLTEQELQQCVYLIGEYHSAEVIYRAIERVAERGHVEQELKLFILGHALSHAEQRESKKKTKKTSRVRNVYGTSVREQILSLADVHIKGCQCVDCLDFFRELPEEETPVRPVRKEVPMCGRSVVPNSRRYEELAQKYGAPKYIISEKLAHIASPGSVLHTFVNWKGTRVLVPMHWGFNSADNSSYNARAETLAEKAQWRDCFAANRCVIPLEAFYEKGKEFKRKDNQELLALGLYGIMPTTNELVTAIVTCDANAAVAPFHERMPVCIPNQPHVVWRWCEEDGLKEEMLKRSIEFTSSELEIQLAA